MEIERHIHIKVGEITDLMTWEQAKKYAERQGMRLPTRVEAFALIDSDYSRELPDVFWISKENNIAYDYSRMSDELVLDDVYQLSAQVVLVTDID